MTKYKGYIIKKLFSGYWIYKTAEDALHGIYSLGSRATMAEAKKYIDSLE